MIRKRTRPRQVPVFQDGVCMAGAVREFYHLLEARIEAYAARTDQQPLPEKPNSRGTDMTKTSNTPRQSLRLRLDADAKRQSYCSVHTRSHGILWTWVGEKSQNEKKRSLRKRKREVVPFCGAYTAPSRVYHPRTKRDIVSYGFGSDGRRVDNMYSASNSRTLNHR